jgi:hypothetical protein
VAAAEWYQLPQAGTSALNFRPLMNTFSPPSAFTQQTSIKSEPLHSDDGDEAVLSTAHPFIAIKETNPESGAWRVRIQSRHAASAVLYPNAIRLQARAVSAQGKSSFTWTNTAAAGSTSTDKLKFRVLVNDGEPAAIEVFPRPATLKSGASPAPVKFCWPAA